MNELQTLVKSLRNNAYELFGTLKGVVLLVGDEEWIKISDHDYENEEIFKWVDDTGIFCGFTLRRVRLNSYLGVGIEYHVGGKSND